MSEAIEEDVTEPRLWKKNGWIAKVIKNDDDHGWAVEMTRVGDAEPALVGPWTMGRDKVNPKPLDQGAFSTLVKTANEVLRRHEQQRAAALHRTVSIVEDGRRIRVDLDVAPDEDDPHGIVGCFDEATGEELKKGRVAAGFKLSAQSALRFLRGQDG
jgi:hypothetical protein